MSFPKIPYYHQTQNIHKSPYVFTSFLPKYLHLWNYTQDELRSQHVFRKFMRVNKGREEEEYTGKPKIFYALASI